MDYEPALRLELMAVTGLNNKVFPNVAPPNTVTDYAVYKSSEGQQEKSLNGYLQTKSVDTELNLITSTFANLKTLEKAVIAKLISFQSRAIGTGGPFIQNISYEKPIELYEPLPKLYRAIINIQVYFEQ